MTDPVDRGRLERRYRRLLLAYPRAYRRRHGDEIVTTLLDAAPAGQARPTRTETLDLLRSGARWRLRVRGPGAVFAVICGVLSGAVAFGALGAFAGWQTARSLPSDAAARAIVAPAMPPFETSARPQRRDVVFGAEPGTANWLTGTLTYAGGHVAFAVNEPAAGTIGRMRAAGWHPTGARDGMTGLPLAFYRDGWRIELQMTIGPGEHRTVTEIRLTRDTPVAAKVLTTLGLPVGALVGWLLVAWAWRRMRDAGPVWSAAIIVSFGIGMLAHFPAALVNACLIVQHYRYPHDLYPTWVGYTVLYVRLLVWLALLALATAVVFVALARGRKPLVQSRHLAGG